MNLSIIYTANLRGDLELLPRLFTFIKSLRQDLMRFAPEDEFDVMLCPVQPPPVRALLLDLGESCAPDVWHCTATGGRSMLIALDALGYHAANVSGFLSPDSRAKLADNVMSMALVDPDHPWQSDDLLLTTPDTTNSFVSTQPSVLSPQSFSLHISLIPADSTRLALHTLHLARVEAGQVGTAYIGGADSEPNLLADAVFDLPADTPPDPTISGTVDFVRNEARFFARKHEE